MRSPGRYVSRGVCSRHGRMPSVRPRSTMMLWPFSKRRTMPRMSSPLRSLYSLKMRSRSASRTRWSRTCLAVCAAMRPNDCACFMSSNSSPSCASGSRFCRASVSAISSSELATTSTTVRILNSSTSPISGLYCASMRISPPMTFLAADNIAFSTACTTIVRSMPFSLLTCSMTRANSCCIRHLGSACFSRPIGSTAKSCS